MYLIKIKKIVYFILLIFLFGISAYLSKTYSQDIQHIIGRFGIISIFVYIFITIISIVAAPVSSITILPVAANTFGPNLTAMYSIIGWTVGSVISFCLIKKIIRPSLNKYKYMNFFIKQEEKLNKITFLLFHILLRISFPVDILSYALGVFSNISVKEFILTTLVGVTPFAFIFSYMAVSDVYIQLTGFTLFAIINVLFILYLISKKDK